MQDIIVGNQGGYVKLTSSNINVASNVFSFDVTLKNLIAQPIGTTNGSTSAAWASRVFFFAGPTSPRGTIDFVNPGGGFFYDSTGTFTNSSQPFFRYVGMLVTGEVSAAKTWSMRFDPGVLTFTFSVFVSTPVAFPDGYVDGHPCLLTLNYGETASLGGTVRSAVGNAIGGSIGYVSSAPSAASVSSGGIVTAGSANSVAYVILSSGAIPGRHKTWINVCASTPTLTNDASVNGVIDATDCCYSSYGSQGRRTRAICRTCSASPSRRDNRSASPSPRTARSHRVWSSPIRMASRWDR